MFTSDDPNTVNTAREYLQSTADVEGANSGVKNVYNSKYRHITLPWLATDAAGATDTDKRYYWGLASSENDVRPITLGVWEEPHLMSLSDNGEDAQTDDYEFRSRAEYGICTLNGTGLKLSKGDASA